MGFLGTVLAIILPVIILTGTAEDGTGVPTLDANFTARPVQDATTCVAPCTVHFDAIGKGRLNAIPYVTEETTDSTFSREFHSLQFMWDFGDPNDPGGRVWPFSGKLKNKAIGGLAGHTYYAPGTYTARLDVKNPAGETDFATATITVADPNTAFTTANTFCFATDNNDWNGCPLDCTTDDNCTVGTNFTTLVNNGNNCSGSDDCGAAGTTKQRYMFRKGDSFTMSSRASWLNSVAPGLVDTFGTGAKPAIAASADLQPGSGWTFSGLAISSSGGGADAIFFGDGFSRLSLIDVDLIRTGARVGCFKSGFSPSQDQFPYLIALINFTCIGPGDTTVMWPKARYMVYMGGEVDKSYSPQVDGHFYSMRAFHSQQWVMQHTYWHGATTTGQNWQWRAYDEEVNGACADDYCASSYNLISDNINDNPRNAFTYVRICGDSGCNCEAGSCGVSAGEQRDVHDWILERNIFRADPGPASSFSTQSTPQLIQITGGSHSIRDNVVDLQSWMTSGGTLTFVNAFGSFAASGGGPASPSSGNIEVTNNTFFNDDAISTAITLLAGGGFTGVACASGCTVRNNLGVTPNNTSSTLTNYTGTNSGSVTSSDNTRSNTEAIFAVAPPELQLTSIEDFALSSSDTIAKDTGYDYSAETDRWGHLDGRGLQRPFGTGWDKGALEYGASFGGAATGVAEYHVATNGNNSNAGSRDLPWLTVARGLQTAGASDTLWVHEGTYNEAITTDVSTITGGSSWATKLNIVGWPGDNVTLSPTSGTRVVFLADSDTSYVEIADIDISASAVSSDAVKITCTGGGCATTGTNASNHIRLRDMTISGSDDQGILVTGLGSTHNEFLGLTVHSNGNNTPVDDHGIYIATANNLVDSCEVYNNASYGVIFYNADAADADGNTITNSHLHDNLDGAGILLASGTGNTAKYNRSESNLQYGIHILGDAVSSVATQNWLYSNTTAAILDSGTGSTTTPNVLVAP